MRTDGIEPPIVIKLVGLQPNSQTKWESFSKGDKYYIHNYFPAAGSPTTTLLRLNRNQRHTLKLSLNIQDKIIIIL
jgi:hypothetical protein